MAKMGAALDDLTQEIIKEDIFQENPKTKELIKLVNVVKEEYRKGREAYMEIADLLQKEINE